MPKQIARLRYLKIAPRKTRLVADALKGLPVQEAEAQLMARPQRAAGALLKLLRSAVANAKNQQMDPARLVVAGVRVDQGPMLKRTMPRAMGRATMIQKKTSHVTLILEEKATASVQRFNIEAVKKEKVKKGKRAAKPAAKQYEAKKDEIKQPEKRPGFFRRIFKRKTV